MRQQNTASTQPGIFNPIFKGIFTALLLTMIFTFIIATVVYVSSLPERYLPVLTLVVLLVSVFFGGNNAAKNAGGRGLVVGFAVGLGFFIILVLLSSIFAPGTLNVWNLLAKLVYSLLAGMLGGISAVARM